VPEYGSHSVAVALLAHLRRARDHIDRHYCEPLDLDGLATVAAVSKYHFARNFQAAYGSFSARFSQLVDESPTAYRDRWAAQGGPHVPGCFLFMRGVLDHAETSRSSAI